MTGSRVGIGERTTDRAPVSHLPIRDSQREAGERRQPCPDHRIGGDARMGTHGADPQAVAIGTDAAHLVDGAQIDQQRRGRESESHRGQKALAAGQRAGVLFVAQQGDGRLDAAGAGDA